MLWEDNEGLEDMARAEHFWKEDEVTWMQTGKPPTKNDPSMA